MSDLAERLRYHVNSRLVEKNAPSLANGAWAMMLEAADKIDRLESDLSELRDYLDSIGEY